MFSLFMVLKKKQLLLQLYWSLLLSKCHCERCELCSVDKTLKFSVKIFDQCEK